MAFTVPLRQAASIRRQCILWRIGGIGGGGGDPAGPRTPNRVVNINPAPVQQQFLQLQLQLLQQQRGRRLISTSAVRCSSNKASNKETDSAAAGAQPPLAQSRSPLGHVGVEAALAASSSGEVRPTIWDEFALKDRVALVSGANRGLGLEMALVLIEAGARAVYCVDLPAQPGSDWAAVSEYVKRMAGTGGRLEYVSADVRDQKAMWKIGEEIGNREGRMDVCVAAAGILKAHTDCLEYPGEEFEEVRLNLVFFWLLLSQMI
jgi:short chain dehydrogenase